MQDSGVGSGTFLKISKPHKIMSGELFSIGKDLNFIIVIDKPSIENLKIPPVVNAAPNMQNMFNEN